MTIQEQPVKVTNSNGNGLSGKKRRGTLKTTGSPQAKNNKWYAVLAVPGKDGRKHTAWKALDIDATGGKNRKKAQQATADLIAQYNSAQIYYSKPILFVDWLDVWLKHKKVSGLSDVTIQGYQSHINKVIAPYYRERGTVLQEMRRADVQRFYDAQSARGLKGKSIKNYAAVIYGALQYAYKEEIIPSNPAARADLPKVEKPAHNVYTLEQLNKLLDAAKDKTIFPAVFIAVHFGLRRSEIAGLEWSAIDLEAKTLTVCKTVSKFSKEVISNRTKTSSSLRTLPIADELISTFRQILAKQAEQRLAAGPSYNTDGDWFCRHPNGNRFHPDYITRAFNNLLEQNGLPHITFHELRHTLASLLIETGSDLKRVSEIMEHADISTTADLYGHLSADAKRDTLGNFCRTLHAV